MKKLLFICAAVVLAAACNSGDKYTIKGTVTGDSDKLVNGTAYLFNRDRENPIRDTAEVINGKFVFKGSVTTPEAYLITIDGIPGMISLFLENAQVTITTDTTFAEPVITGGPTQTLLNRYGEQSKALGEKYDIMNVIKDMRRPTSTEASGSTVSIRRSWTQYVRPSQPRLPYRISPSTSSCRTGSITT